MRSPSDGDLKISFTTTAQNVPHAFFDHSEPKKEKINAIDR